MMVGEVGTMLPRPYRLVRFSIFVALTTFVPALSQTVEGVCGQKGNWANCGISVRRELEKKPSDPKRVVELAGLWGSAYGDRFDALRKARRIETATPDSAKIFAEVNSRLNPIDIAKDKSEEVLLKKYLSWVATLMEWMEKPLSQALKAFFDGSETATDYDELKLMNDDIQKRVMVLLDPHLRSDWKDKLKRAVIDASPQLIKP
jgi:hypothetical protein